jgi:two-component system, NtrC family, sensor kinase
VARRWRIRHKLMLGLATAIGILAMLLAGTLNGLWSYYVTMKSIESKLEELDKAEVLKSAVSNLTRSLPESSNNPVQTFDTFKRSIPQTRRALDGFEKAFQETLRRELTDDDGDHIDGLIAGLRRHLDTLEGKVPRPDEFNGAVVGRGSGEPYIQRRKQVLPKVDELEHDAGDIRDGVRTDLKNRIDASKMPYRLSLAILIITTVLVLVLIFTVLRFFYCWVFNPIRDLQQGVNQVARGDFDRRITVESGDEMEELAEAFNDMTGRLRDLYRDMAAQINERSRQLVRSERLASVGFLAAGVAHEINNPLASIAFCAEALEARLAELQEPVRGTGRSHRDVEIFGKYLKMIQEEAFRCKNITERLLEFSRGGEKKREQANLVEVVQAVLDVMHHHSNSKGKEVIFNPTGPLIAWVNVDEIKSVILNLVANALESMEEGGRLSIALATRAGMAELVFTDTGYGMSAEVLENIFEPFFTRNRSGKGTGLGLTITHRIISQHDGEIEADSPGIDHGSTFRVRLPLGPPPSSSEEPRTGVGSQESGVRYQESGINLQRPGREGRAA